MDTQVKGFLLSNLNQQNHQFTSSNLQTAPQTTWTSMTWLFFCQLTKTVVSCRLALKAALPGNDFMWFYHVPSMHQKRNEFLVHCHSSPAFAQRSSHVEVTLAGRILFLCPLWNSFRATMCDDGISAEARTPNVFLTSINWDMNASTIINIYQIAIQPLFYKPDTHACLSWPMVFTGDFSSKQGRFGRLCPMASAAAGECQGHGQRWMWGADVPIHQTPTVCCNQTFIRIRIRWKSERSFFMESI